MGRNFDLAVHILCLGSPEQVQALQWALDHLPSTHRQFKVYRAQVNELLQKSQEYDFIVLLLDLGQPVPTENLRQVAEFKEGLCCFMQPTPGQLLALSEISDWGALSWDGVSFDEVAQRTHQLIVNHEERIQKKAFLESATIWLKKNVSRVGQLQLLNPPQHWSGYSFRNLDESESVLSLGQMSSKANWKLPLKGDKDICEFVFHQGSWTLKVFEPALVQGSLDFENIKAGDQLQIGELRFMVKMSAGVEEIVGAARKFSILEEAHEVSGERHLHSISSKSENLETCCASLLYSQAVGELQVKSGHKRGIIFFYAGIITASVAGSVDGAKALLRMLMWDNSEWKFVTEQDYRDDHNSMRINLLQFTNMLQSAKKLNSKLEAFVPAPSVLLQVDPIAFHKKEEWTPDEAKVVAAIAEFHNVRDILNYCSLPDLNIYDTLVRLRKQGLIRPTKAVAKIRREI